MGRYLAWRLLIALCVALTVSALVFMLLRVSGDLAQAIAGENATAADVARIRGELGLNRPMVVQYADWLLGLAKGDFGESFFLREPVLGLILDRLPNTVILTFFAAVIALVISLPAGIAAAFWRDGLADRAIMLAVALIQATPGFFSALLLVIYFAVHHHWFPVSGSETWKHFILPALAVGIDATPAFIRLIKAGMSETLLSDYVRTARAKGLLWPRTLLHHALRNAALPLIALVAVKLGFMLSGSVVIEAIFVLNGIGYLAWEAINRADYPIVQGVVLFVALAFTLLTVAADLVNRAVDPRLRAD